ncbi:tumor necrosis factor receptor superfamily member 6 isoform X2 [Trachinotus anak]|uniref:tumor necrosis factor receptor superfamily member 6 isoform X2 n=1 Tax=Trachinotus anak TaxID=443729 RepID=UPI0039F18814
MDVGGIRRQAADGDKRCFIEMSSPYFDYLQRRGESRKLPGKSPGCGSLFNGFSERVYSSASVLTFGNDTQHPIKRLLRNRRQDVCQDGHYQHDGKTCCLCAAGQQLVNHCDKKPDDGKCEPCEPANLEEDAPCSAAQDAKCRCKKDHFCSSGKESCLLCQPCKKCRPDDVKVACTSTNDTVCNPKKDGPPVATIVGTIVGTLLAVALAVVAVIYWQRRKSNRRGETLPGSSREPDVELQPLTDFQPHLPDIAEVLGWKDMQDVAMRSGMLQTTIDACKLDHPGDSQEQTLQLLMKWVEKEGMNGSKRLIQILKDSNKLNKVEQVTRILRDKQ